MDHQTDGIEPTSHSADSGCRMSTLGQSEI